MVQKSIIEQVAAERQKKDEDERRRQRMLARIYELKNQGMDTARLEKVVKGDVQEAANVFSEYDNKLSKLAGVWNRLYTIDFRGFEAEYSAIYSRLRDPYAVDSLNKELDTLEKAVQKKRKEEIKIQKEEQEKREKDLKRYNLEKVIMSYKARGYKTDDLEVLLKEDLDKAREAVASFETDVRHLWEIGQRLNTFDVRGLEAEYNEIRSLLYDHTKVEEAQTKLGILEKKVAERAKASGQTWQEQKAAKEQWQVQRQKEIDQRLQAEARKAAENKLKADKEREEWKKRLAEEKQAVAKARLFLNKLSLHMKEHHPQLSPRGLYLGDRKWSVESHLDKLEVKGTLSSGLFRDDLIISCRFVSSAEIPSQKEMIAKFKAIGAQHKAQGQYQAACFMMNRPSRTLIKAVKEFKNPHCAAIIYDIAEDRVHYNKKNFGADIFSGYFDLNVAPKGLKEIFKPLEDQYEVIYQKDIGPRFGMSQSEIKRMMKHLMDTNQVYPVEKRKMSFSFA